MCIRGHTWENEDKAERLEFEKKAAEEAAARARAEADAARAKAAQSKKKLEDAEKW